MGTRIAEVSTARIGILPDIPLTRFFAVMSAFLERRVAIGNVESLWTTHVSGFRDWKRHNIGPVYNADNDVDTLDLIITIQNWS
ncbi:MAG: hypothetical protein L0Y44_10765 [Phycisphaerales bacterium]|nr:hypothetical protein [Phycisphaerales bacterium]